MLITLRSEPTYLRLADTVKETARTEFAHGNFTAANVAFSINIELAQKPYLHPRQVTEKQVARILSEWVRYGWHNAPRKVTAGWYTFNPKCSCYVASVLPNKHQMVGGQDDCKIHGFGDK